MNRNLKIIAFLLGDTVPEALVKSATFLLSFMPTSDFIKTQIFLKTTLI
ncbi:MAG: hypothetical protein P8I11_01550 [Bacteroidia bacterium]|nr:hypothetical protein [Bacteroidia bacterium]